MKSENFSQCERNSAHNVGNKSKRRRLLRHSMPISMLVSIRGHMKRSNVKRFLNPSVSLSTHMWKAKEKKISSMFMVKLFSNLQHYIFGWYPVFHANFRKIQSSWIWWKLLFLGKSLHWTIPLTLWENLIVQMSMYTQCVMEICIWSVQRMWDNLIFWHPQIASY